VAQRGATGSTWRDGLIVGATWLNVGDVGDLGRNGLDVGATGSTWATWAT
jgi:hypothetical protein